MNKAKVNDREVRFGFADVRAKHIIELFHPGLLDFYDLYFVVQGSVVLTIAHDDQVKDGCTYIIRRKAVLV